MGNGARGGCRETKSVGEAVAGSPGSGAGMASERPGAARAVHRAPPARESDERRF